MYIKNLYHYLIFSFFFLSHNLFALEIVVTPTTPYDWAPASVRTDSTVSLTTTQPRVGQITGLGDSSIEFTTNFITPGQDKADYELIWQDSLVGFTGPPISIAGAFTFPNRTLMNLTEIGYDYYRDSVGSATLNSSIHPALRLLWYNNNGTPATADDTYGFFIYELADSGPTTIVTDTWVSNNLLNTGIFWVFCLKCNPASVGGATLGRISRFDKTLPAWRTSGPFAIINTSQPEAPDFSLGNTYIIGANTGIGSGWGNDLIMYVDNIHLAFGATDDKVYNFENDAILSLAVMPVPTISKLMLLVLTLVLFIFTWKRRLFSN